MWRRNAVAIAWYKREQWARLRELSSDADQLEESWEEWYDIAEEKLRELRQIGLRVERAVIDVEALARWCRENGRILDGAARSEYAALLLRRRHLS